MNNSEFIRNEIAWLQRLLHQRINSYFGQSREMERVDEIPPQDLPNCSYANFLANNTFDIEERIGLILSFAPLLMPQVFDCFRVKNSDTGLPFAEFGGFETDGFWRPTLSTLLFVLYESDVSKKIAGIKKFSRHRVFSSANHFHQEPQRDCINWVLSPTDELIDNLILEKKFEPRFTSDFPARKLETRRTWNDLVLSESTMKEIQNIRLWIEYGDKLLKEWQMETMLKPGYRALFYGPSGCGKTFTASLLGQATQRDVYCVDLSMVVSKYIGETEKNLSKVFESAENKDWILFFDEADALFGKRSNTKDAHDRYANQEVAYLLQRVESYNGLVILSTNLKANIDDAFSRRFQSIIRFSPPDAKLRKILWEKTFSPHCRLGNEIDLDSLAQTYELSGGSIVNIVQYASLLAISRNEAVIRKDDLTEGIRLELQKEGKMMN